MKTTSRSRARFAGTWLLVCLVMVLGSAASFIPSDSGSHVAYAECSGVGPPPDMETICEPTATPTPTNTPISE